MWPGFSRLLSTSSSGVLNGSSEFGLFMRQSVLAFRCLQFAAVASLYERLLCYRDTPTQAAPHTLDTRLLRIHVHQQAQRIQSKALFLS